MRLMNYYYKIFKYLKIMSENFEKKIYIKFSLYLFIDKTKSKRIL